MRYASFLTALALGAAASHAMATPVVGTTSGVWVNPTPSASPVVTTGAGTANFTWGNSTGTGTGPNRLVFTDNPFNSSTETAFKVGSLSYFNGTTAAGSEPASVQLSLTLNFNSPAIPSVNSTYSFNLVSTPNTTDPNASADFVDLPSTFGTTLFTIDGTTYDVKLVGFENVVGDGYLASNSQSFHVREGSTATADLYAEVTTQTAAVPEPENLALMLGGLSVLGIAALRRRGA